MRKAISCLIILLVSSPFHLQRESEDSTPAQKDKCPVCGMFVSMFADWNARIEFKDGTAATFDGAKDMFKYYLDMKKYNPQKKQDDVTAISVKDYYSKDIYRCSAGILCHLERCLRTDGSRTDPF